MSGIVDARGQKVEAVKTDVKKAHDPAEVAAVLKRINDHRDICFKEFRQEMTPPKDAPASAMPDWDAAREHYGKKHEDLVLEVKKGSVPIKADEKAVYKLIDSFQLILKAARESKMFLQHVDLSEHGFKLVGIVPQGTLWMSSHCAVAVNEAGGCAIYLRLEEETEAEWFSGWMPRPARRAQRTSMEYTLENMSGLLGVLGWGRAIAPTEMHVNDCRTKKLVRSRTNRLLGWPFVLAMALTMPGMAAGQTIEHFGQYSALPQCNGRDSTAQSFLFPGGTLDNISMSVFSRFSQDHPAMLRILQGDGVDGPVLWSDSVIVPGISHFFSDVDTGLSAAQLEPLWYALWLQLDSAPMPITSMATTWAVGVHFPFGPLTAMISLDTAVSNNGYRNVTALANCFVPSCSPLEGDLYADGRLYWGNPPLPFDDDADMAFDVAWHDYAAGMYAPSRNGAPLSTYQAFDLLGRLVAEGSIACGRLIPPPPSSPSLLVLRWADGVTTTAMIVER